MQYRYLVVTLFLLLPISFISSQTLELYGKKVTFGATLKEQKNNLWEDGGQIESNYSYIEVYEGEKITGEFYKNKLILIDVVAYETFNDPYPKCEDIENILMNLTPYKKFNKENGLILVEVFKTDINYICKSSTDMSASYMVIPVKILNEIRDDHPEYMINYF